jgi:hypothetical protein
MVRSSFRGDHGERWQRLRSVLTGKSEARKMGLKRGQDGSRMGNAAMEAE